MSVRYLNPGQRFVPTPVALLFLAACAPAFATSNDTQQQLLLDQASSTYCQQYTDETVHYLLTQGTPDDVTMMENAVGFLKDGQWKIDSETLSARTGSRDSELIVQVRCTWTTPIDDLNGPVELQYKVTIDVDAQSVLSVEDSY